MFYVKEQFYKFQGTDMLEFPKMFSTGSSATLLNATLLPETPGNRFKPLTFAKHFERHTLWNVIEQRTPSYMNTALKVLLTIPLLLIQKITQAIQEIGNAGISLGSCLFSKRTVVVVTPPTIDKLSTGGEPILDDSKKGVSKTEIVKPLELDHLELVKIRFASIVEPSWALNYAASTGYLEGVKIALDNPETNINCQFFYSGRNDFGPTALMGAALDGHKEIVELLLNAGADSNIVDASEMNNCELSIVGKTFKNGTTALMLATKGRNRINNAGDKEIVELLLNAGADPNIQDFHGNTALLLAAKHGHKEIVELLLNKGAKPNIKQFTQYMVTFRSQNDSTALMEAAQNGHKEIVELLLDAKADPNIQDQYGNTALILATNQDQPDTVSLLLKAKADPNIQNKQGVSALIRATCNGYTDVVKKLIGVNADLNVKNSHGLTALIWAADRGHKEIAELLINAKADLNIQNKAGNTALILAVFLGREDIVKLLIDAKADLNIQDQSGGTALMWAAEKRHKEVVKRLLDAGTDADIKDNDGKTVLSRLRSAYQADDIVNLIKSYL